MTAAAQGDAWKLKEQGEEAKYDREKEQAQLSAVRVTQQEIKGDITPGPGSSATERDFEGGFGGQEDLEDRYATTCGEH